MIQRTAQDREYKGIQVYQVYMELLPITYEIRSNPKQKSDMKAKSELLLFRTRTIYPNKQQEIEVTQKLKKQKKRKIEG